MSSSDGRRRFLRAAGALAGGAGVLILTRPAEATPASMQSTLRELTGGAPVQRGRVKLQLPPLVENGNSVAFTVAVDSPMTADDHVRAIHVLTEQNPQPNVISVRFGPRAGKAQFSSRTRLADSQTVHAVAELSDGSFWSDTVDVVVTLSACIGDLV